jgi:hypothetical protein
MKQVTIGSPRHHFAFSSQIQEIAFFDEDFEEAGSESKPSGLRFKVPLTFLLASFVLDLWNETRAIIPETFSKAVLPSETSKSLLML